MSNKKTILFLAFLFMTWVLITNALNHVNNFESLISSSRIFISVLLSLVLYKNNDINKILNFTFGLGVLNGIVVSLQILDFIYEPFLPEFMHYGYFYNKLFDNASYNHTIRNGGLMIGLQVSSLLSFLAILIGYYKKIKYIYLWLAILIIPIIMGSRTIIVISSFFFIYIFAKNKLLMAFVSICGFYLINLLPDLTSFYELRIKVLFEILTSGDFTKDYSLRDTLSFFDRSIDIKTFLIGNGMPQYSQLGGNDPLYTRWLFQSGFISLILLIVLVVANITLGKRSKAVKLGLLLVFFLTSIKAELLISIGVFDLFLMSNHASFSKKENLKTVYT